MHIFNDTIYIKQFIKEFVTKFIKNQGQETALYKEQY